MKVIVTGGRDFTNYDLVKKVLQLFQPRLIIHGDCSGADQMAKRFAIENKIPHEPHPADWAKWSGAAGPIRNGSMLKRHPDAVVIAFQGARGTADCVAQAISKKHVVLKVC